LWAWWRDKENRPKSADEQSLVAFPAPVLRVTIGSMSLSALVIPKIDLGGNAFNDYTIVYAQTSFGFR
jgi:hypothetical protein